MSMCRSFQHPFHPLFPLPIQYVKVVKTTLRGDLYNQPTRQGADI